MTSEDSPPTSEEQSPEAEDLPPVLQMPRWIPLLIALVLVIMATLAVYTGLRYRGGRPGRSLSHQATETVRQGARDGGAPGEPEAGASRVLHGDSGENVPEPSTAPFEQMSRVRISGSKESVTTTWHAKVRRGLMLRVTPGDAMLYVNDQPIGLARQFSTPEEIYEFANEGNFTIRLVAPGYQETVYLVTADPAARDEVALIEGMLEKEKPDAAATK